MQKQPNYKTN